jgi:hypothetical protein
MKKLFKTLNQIFINLIYFKRWRKAKQYEKMLKKGILNREVEKIKLLREASVLIPKKTKKGRSEYIPLSAFSKARIKAMILKEFGYKMNLLGMIITDDLKFI